MTSLLPVEPLSTEHGFFPLELYWSAFPARLGAAQARIGGGSAAGDRRPKGGI